ncbi:MAG: hypothetical protein N3G21_08610 [Candidatus Hydrogenedentes bacterium]|nr:hypothetical protein [Candidatus Hydrogenedentota bacterium]
MECYAFSSVFGEYYVGGLVARETGPTPQYISSYWDIEKSGISESEGGVGKTTSEMKRRSTYVGWDFESTWDIIETQTYPWLRALGPVESYIPLVNKIEIWDVKELVRIGKDWNYPWFGYYKLKKDIDAGEATTWDNGKGFFPIELFTGTFDGGGRVIKNLYINRPEERTVGLFRRLFNAKVSNLKLENVYVVGGEEVGSLAGIAIIGGGEISSCNATGEVSVVGITNSSSSYSCAGGIIGMLTSGKISKCSAQCNVFANVVNGHAGGIVGVITEWSGNSFLEKSYSSCYVLGSKNAGGIVGYFEFANIQQCVSKSVVSGSFYCGGIVGYNEQGGIYQSYFDGQIEPPSFGGGIAAYTNYGSIYECYAVGTGDIRGIVAGCRYLPNDPLPVQNSYWDKTVTNFDYASMCGGEGKTTEEMKRRETYKDWNFDNVWVIDEGLSYPYLQWEKQYSDFSGIWKERAFEEPKPIDLGIWNEGFAIGWRFYDYVVELNSNVQSLAVYLEGDSHNDDWILLGAVNRLPEINSYQWKVSGGGEQPLVLFIAPAIRGKYYFSVVRIGEDEPVRYRLKVGVITRGVSGVNLTRLSSEDSNFVVVSGVGLNDRIRLKIVSCANGEVLGEFAPVRVSENDAEFEVAFEESFTGRAKYILVWEDGAEEEISGCSVEIYRPLVGPVFQGVFVVPDLVRTNRVYTGLFVYRNVGDVPMNAPLCLITTPLNWPLRYKGEQVWRDGKLLLLCTNRDRPWTVLAPGEGGAVQFEFMVTTLEGGGKFEYVLCDPNSERIPWDEYYYVLKPQDLSEEEWSNNWVDIQNYLGLTWADLYRRILLNAYRIGYRQESTYNVGNIISTSVREHLGLPIAYINGKVIWHETGREMGGVLVKLYQLSPDNNLNLYDSTITSSGGFYKFDNVPDGNYQLEVEGFTIVSENSDISIVNQIDVVGVTLEIADLPDPPQFEEIPIPDDQIIMSRGDGNKYLLLGYGDTTELLRWENGSWISDGKYGNDLSKAEALWSGFALPGQENSEVILLVWREETETEARIMWQLGIWDGSTGSYMWSEPNVFRNGEYDFGIPLLGYLGHGRFVVVWLLRNKNLVDDFDVYYGELEITPKELKWVEPERWSKSSKDFCLNFVIGDLNNLNKNIPILGGKFEFTINASVCPLPPDCSKMVVGGSGSVGARVKFAGPISLIVGGRLTEKSTIVCEPEPHTIFNERTLSLTGALQFSSKHTWPFIFTVGAIPIQGRFIGNFVVGGAVTGKLVWTQEDSLTPQYGEILGSINSEISGRVNIYDLGMLDYGLVGARVSLGGSIRFKYAQNRLSFAGVCLTLTGSFDVAFGFLGGSLSGKWGDACKVGAVQGGYEEWGKDYHLVIYGNRNAKSSIAEEVILEERITPFYGSANVYTGVGLPVLGNTATTDLFNDNSPAMVFDEATGRLVLVWTKDEGDYHNLIGSRVVYSEYNGLQWSEVARISEVGFNSSPSIDLLDGSGKVIAVWSSASSEGLNIDSELQLIKSRMEISDIHYAVRNEDGSWSQDRAVLENDGQDIRPIVASDRNGTAIVIWLNYQDDMQIGEYRLLCSKYSGGTWSEPVEVAKGLNISKFDVRYWDSKYVLVWQMLDSSITETNILRAYYAVSEDGIEWSEPTYVRSDEGKSYIVNRDWVTGNNIKAIDKFADVSECCQEEGEGEEGEEEDPSEPISDDIPKSNVRGNSGKDTSVVSPLDPNEKAGPTGRGEVRGVYLGEELVYTVYFENVPTATAPAQEVVIEDYLSDYLDWSTLRILDIRWGDYSVELPREDLFSSARVKIKDYREGVDKEWLVDVVMNFNVRTGCVKWIFRTLDPETMQLPEDVLAGFLPPNDESSRGEGHITFSIKVREDAPIGSVIRNRATIQFDVQSPITTNEVDNTIILPILPGGEGEVSEGEGEVIPEGSIDGGYEEEGEGFFEGEYEGDSGGEGVEGEEGTEGSVDGGYEGDGEVTTEGVIDGQPEGELTEGAKEGESQEDRPPRRCGCFNRRNKPFQITQYPLDLAILALLMLTMSGMKKRSSNGK